MRKIGILLAAVLAAAVWLVPSAANAATYTVTAVPQTWHFTYDYRTQSGTRVVSTTYSGSWAAVDDYAGTAKACNPKPATMSGTWQSTTDLSTHHFNSVSAAGVQRRGCSFSTVGPNAVNAACVPADCQIKVTFTLKSVVDTTEPTYTAWQPMSTGEHSYSEIANDISTDCPQTTWFANCSAPIPTLHPDQATTLTMSSCPPSTTDMIYDCRSGGQSQSSAGTVTTPSGGATVLTISRHGHKLMVSTTGPVARERVVLQKKAGRHWVTRASKTYRHTRVSWHAKVRPGRYRIVVTPGSASGGRLVRAFHIR